jgi:hypothetical protein
MSAEPQRTAKAEEVFLRFQCGCDRGSAAYVRHYEIVHCSRCGGYWWALQPVRSGPLVAFAWPGLHPQRLGVSVVNKIGGGTK